MGTQIIRLAALLQACRDLIAWNKEERQQLLAERETLRSENAEFARNLEARNQEVICYTQYKQADLIDCILLIMKWLEGRARITNSSV